MRTGMLADCLQARGHSIVWWSTNFYHQKKVLLSSGYKEVVIADNYVIKLIKGLPYRKNFSLRRYLHQKLIAKRFKKMAASCERPDVIIASMPDYNLAYEAVCFGKARGISVLIDIRDLWPDIFIDHVPRKFQNIARWFLKSDFKKLEISLGDADALIAVSEGYLQWGLDRIPRPQNHFDRVFYLGYKGDSKKGVGDRLDFPVWLRGRKDQKLFVFIGTFGVSYELELILEAAKRFSKLDRTDICFVLAGTGEKYELIKRKASRLENVVLPGWIGQKESNALLKRAYVGLVPYRSVENTMPNKPFEYLAYGLPILSSLKGEMEALIKKYRIGYTYQAGDLDGFCDIVVRLANEPALLKELSNNAKRVFNEHFDAERIYESYVRHIESIYEQQRDIRRDGQVVSI